MDYMSTMSGAVFKLVACEHCGTEYFYQLKRVATGQGTSLLFLDNQGAAERAASCAEETLRLKLYCGVDLVPCPACGWYQQNMVAKARRQHRRWMLNAGACLTIGLIPVTFFGMVFNAVQRGGPAIPWPLFFAGIGSLAILGIGLMVAKCILAARYDPNSQEVEIRKRLSQGRAILRKEWEQRVQDQQGNQHVTNELRPPPDLPPGSDAAR